MDSRNFLVPSSCHTVKFLNFRTPENFAVIYLKLKKEAQPLSAKFNEIANSEDPNQTAPQGAV